MEPSQPYDHSAAPRATASGVAAVDSLADQIVGEFMPSEFDWKHVVRTYPLSSLTVAAVGGYLIARSHGAIIVAAVSALASDKVGKAVHELLDVNL